MAPALRFRIESLHVHPVKACAGLRVPRLRFDADGVLEDDREWVIVDERGEVTWQGAQPRLALVRPARTGGALALTSPGARTAALVPGTPRVVQAWSDDKRRMESLEGEDGGDEAAALLADVTGAALRAVRLARAARLREGVNPVHLASTQSLDEVQQALAASGLPPVPMARFRPNVVLSACDGAAWAEERVARWTARDRGSPSLLVIGPCVRCVVPNVDLETAEVAAEPLRIIARQSRARRDGGPPVFGIYARPSGAGVLEEGQELEGALAEGSA